MKRVAKYIKTWIPLYVFFSCFSTRLISRYLSKTTQSNWTNKTKAIIHAKKEIAKFLNSVFGPISNLYRLNNRSAELTSLIYLPNLFKAWKRSLSNASISCFLCKIKWTLWTGYQITTLDKTCWDKSWKSSKFKK